MPPEDQGSAPLEAGERRVERMVSDGTSTATSPVVPARAGYREEGTRS